MQKFRKLTTRQMETGTRSTTVVSQHWQVLLTGLSEAMGKESPTVACIARYTKRIDKTTSERSLASLADRFAQRRIVSSFVARTAKVKFNFNGLRRINKFSVLINQCLRRGL